MAKSHKAKVARYCVQVSWPTYGGYDEITGWRSRSFDCTRSLAKATASAKAHARRLGDPSEGHIEIVRYVANQRGQFVQAPQKSWPRPRRLRPRNDIPF